jgi:hypothetical protein
MRVTFSVERQVKDQERQNLISRPRGRAQKVALAKSQNSPQILQGLLYTMASFEMGP